MAIGTLAHISYPRLPPPPPTRSLKKFLHDASDDSEIMEEPSLFPFFTLSSITHPQKHNSFVSPGSTTAIFADDTLSGDDTLSNIWTMKLREEVRLMRV